MMTFLIYLAAWWIIGAAGFIYWWTREYDFTADLITLLIGCGLVGPLAWIVGYTIHGTSEDGGPRVIFKKRKK